MNEDLELALELADAADEITRARFRSEDLVVETKPDLSPVSEADRAVELAVRERLAARRPKDAIVGEEYGGADGQRRWIVDPIWATLIALEEAGELILGVVSAPSLCRRWWASRGAGAFVNGARVRVSAVSELADAVLLWSGIEEWDEVGRGDAVIELARRCWRSRGVGDFWQYMLVAEGAAEVALDPVVSLWDLAAPLVIVEEAGGRLTDLEGARTADGGSGLATNGRVHEAVLEIAARRPTG